MDYTTMTKQYLQRYPWLKYYVQHLTEQVQDTYDTATPMVGQYGEHVGHTTVERLHPGATLAENRGFQVVKADLREAQREVQTIEDIIGMLTGVEQRIIRLRYLEQEHPVPWEEIAEVLMFDVRHCHRLHNRAIKHLSIALFGLKAVS